MTWRDSCSKPLTVAWEVRQMTFRTQYGGREMKTSSLHVAFAAAVGLCLSAPRETQALVFYDSESSFLSAAAIESTENFDAYTSGDGFITRRIALDGVSYFATSCTNRCWMFYYGALVSNDIADNTLSFGSGRYVDTLGFRLIDYGGPGSGREVVVTEKNGSSTVMPADGGGYFGFTSGSGIESVLVRDDTADGAHNWFFDDVARGEIIGGAPLPDYLPAIPEPSTYALFTVGCLMVAVGVWRRRV